MKKKHFYAVWVNYLPNSAQSNRMMAYLKAWSKMDVEVTVVFLLPDRLYSKLSISYPNIHIKYMWDKLPVKYRIVHYFLYSLYASRFMRSLTSGEHVYVYGQANLLPLLTRRKDINVYHETTEHPSAITLGVKFHTTTIEQYLATCKNLNGVFVISSQLKKFFVEKGVDVEKIRIVNMLADSTRFEGLEKQADRKYVAYCGNASNNKDGVDVLIRAFAVISPKYEDLYLYIIGKAPDSNEENNNAHLAEELGVGNKVVFTGMVNYNDMPKLLKNATLLALARPNSIQALYGFPTKLGEYLLTGNPVVITDTGDISLFLRNKVSAMISKADDVDDFAQKMDWLLEHPIEAASIGENGRKIAVENFNSDTEGKKIVNYIFSQNE